MTVSLFPLQLCEYAGQVIDRLLRPTELVVNLPVFGIYAEMPPICLIEQCAEQIAHVPISALNQRNCCEIDFSDDQNEAEVLAVVMGIEAALCVK